MRHTSTVPRPLGAAILVVVIGSVVARVVSAQADGGAVDSRAAIQTCITANTGWPAGQVSEFQLWNQ
jgi:hypothetical protein